MRILTTKYIYLKVISKEEWTANDVFLNVIIIYYLKITEIKSPSRCIDKNLLMVVTQNRAGEQIFLIDQYRYQVMRDGELQKQPLIKPGDIR